MFHNGTECIFVNWSIYENSETWLTRVDILGLDASYIYDMTHPIRGLLKYLGVACWRRMTGAAEVLRGYSGDSL